MSRRICPDYTGVACIDGTCPKAREEELLERCEDVPRGCGDCWYYEGCRDCYWSGRCPDEKEQAAEAAKTKKEAKRP